MKVIIEVITKEISDSKYHGVGLIFNTVTWTGTYISHVKT